MCSQLYDGGRGTTTITGAWMPAGRIWKVGAEGGFAPRVSPCIGDHPAPGALAGGEYFAALLDGIHHVPFSRAAAPRAPPSGRGGGRSAPAACTDAASPLLFGRLAADPSLRDGVSSLLADMGLGRIAARCMPAAPGGGPPRPAARKGSGSALLIALLAVLAGSPRGSVITVEEPEMRLDPEAQYGLAVAMARLSAEEDKQVIFTSHSGHILYPLLGCVRKEGFPLACGDLAIHYLDTDETGAPAGAERLDVNEHGQVAGGLRGFWNANMRALDDLMGRDHGRRP